MGFEFWEQETVTRIKGIKGWGFGMTGIFEAKNLFTESKVLMHLSFADFLHT